MLKTKRLFATPRQFACVLSRSTKVWLIPPRLKEAKYPLMNKPYKYSRSFFPLLYFLTIWWPLRFIKWLLGWVLTTGGLRESGPLGTYAKGPTCLWHWSKTTLSWFCLCCCCFVSLCRRYASFCGFVSLRSFRVSSWWHVNLSDILQEARGAPDTLGPWACVRQAPSLIHQCFWGWESLL